MSQVFLSYRHVQPDEGLADQLCADLSRRGIPVFRDKQIQVGLDWVAEIDRQLRASSTLVVLLSEASVQSDLVRQEVQTAYELRREGKIVILPIRVGFMGSLPYDLAAYLSRIQYIAWNPGDPVEPLSAQIHAAISGEASFPMIPLGDAPTDFPARVSLPAAPPPILETGTISLDSPFYVRRRDDDWIEHHLAQRGSTIVVRGYLQSGKSSLLVRAHAWAKRNGLRSVYVDFQSFDEPEFASFEAFLQSLAQRIALELCPLIQPNQFWKSGRSGLWSFSMFLERAVLDATAPPVVILLDEVDRLFDHPYYSNFFDGVRHWHNSRAIGQLWRGLHLILAVVTDQTLWLANRHQSPFNVGTVLQLTDFTAEQVADLNARYGSPLRSQADLDGLIRLVGGQPYLVRKALYTLATEGWSLAQLNDEATREDGPFGDHLRRHLWTLHSSERLQVALGRVARGEGCDDEALFWQLRHAGLITGEARSEARLRCGLYQAYFSRHL